MPRPLTRMRIRLHVHQVEFALFDDCVMHLLAVRPRTISPTGYCPFISPKRMHNRLDRTSIREQCDHHHDQFGRLAQPLKHGSTSPAKCVTARATPVALTLAIMNRDVALPCLASCTTRHIRAKLEQRVHRLWIVCFHRHSMSMFPSFFKPSFLLFHQLLGFYHVTRRET